MKLVPWMSRREATHYTETYFWLLLWYSSQEYHVPTLEDKVMMSEGYDQHLVGWVWFLCTFLNCSDGKAVSRDTWYFNRIHALHFLVLPAFKEVRCKTHLHLFISHWKASIMQLYFQTPEAFARTWESWNCVFFIPHIREGKHACEWVQPLVQCFFCELWREFKWNIWELQCFSVAFS